MGRGVKRAVKAERGRESREVEASHGQSMWRGKGEGKGKRTGRRRKSPRE